MKEINDYVQKPMVPPIRDAYVFEGGVQLMEEELPRKRKPKGSPLPAVQFFPYEGGIREI